MSNHLWHMCFKCTNWSFKFSVTDYFSKFTCESFDAKFNANAIKEICADQSEVKAMCPATCDNYLSANPSCTSSAPSTKPTVSPTTCVDKKTKGKIISYVIATVDLTTKAITFPNSIATYRENKKCKHLRKQSEVTIDKACSSLNISLYCRATCNNCEISAAPSISVIEPECDDNDKYKWKYKKELITCKELHNKKITYQENIGRGKVGAKTNCINTYNRCSSWYLK